MEYVNFAILKILSIQIYLVVSLFSIVRELYLREYSDSFFDDIFIKDTTLSKEHQHLKNSKVIDEIYDETVRSQIKKGHNILNTILTLYRKEKEMNTLKNPNFHS